jgi:secreted trypsin-like serine protease
MINVAARQPREDHQLPEPAAGHDVHHRAEQHLGRRVQRAPGLHPGGGRGGTCFGDSGGPVLVDDSDVIVAVNSFVTNGACAGTGYSYRTDQQVVIDWILDHAGSEADEIVVVPAG